MNVHARRDRTRVVIVGAGFGGLWAARSLAGQPVSVTLLDRNNYHTFLPLLYQVAAAELEPTDIAYPVRNIVRDLPNVRFLQSEVSNIDFHSRIVKTIGFDISYDYLILASGTTTDYFDIPGAEENAFPLKTVEDSVALRNHILSCFENAVTMESSRRRKKTLTFVVIGGGSTGVEFAGALIELINRPLAKDYPDLDFREVEVLMIEREDRILSGLPPLFSQYAYKRLTSLGVKIRLGTGVKSITPENIELEDGTIVSANTVVWTGGVSGTSFIEEWNLPVNDGGRAGVLPTLQLSDYREVYVVGDLARVKDNRGPYPMLAPVAIQQGTTAAENIVRQVMGEKPVPFSYRDRGTLVVIGRNAAVASIGSRTFTGFVAWLLWLGVHIVKLMGFRNRLLVLINWAWDYFFFERAVRIILPTTRSSGTERKINATKR